MYGRRRLGETWGFLAGWGFVVGKTASCAAMALTLGAYTWPERPRVVAAAAVVVLVPVNCLGVCRDGAADPGPGRAHARRAGRRRRGRADPADGRAAEPRRLVPARAARRPQAAGLLFFAFAGYARIATLGEEVRDPARTIPRAIPLALGVVVAVYLGRGRGTVGGGTGALAASPAPLATAAGAGPFAVVVRVGGAVASAGVLLTLLAGVGRTTLAMARDRELPAPLAAVHPRHRVPHRAELLIGAVVLVLVLTADLRDAIGFSSLAVLVYYAVAHGAALTLGGPGRRRVVAVLGLGGCLVLAATLPLTSVLAGVGVLVAGLAARAVVTGLRARRAG